MGLMWVLQPATTAAHPDVGLTPMEWFTTTLALVLLYILLAGFFAVLLIIADRIRHAGDSYERPGRVFPFVPADD